MAVDTSFSLGPGQQGGLRLGGARPQTYTVVRGDTLWDLSARFWGDPYFWPTLWSYNPSIGNAHFIYPGDILRFTVGSPVRPPGMAVDGPTPPDSPAPAADTPVASTSWDAAETVSYSATSRPLECAPPMPFVSQRDGTELKSTLPGFLKEERFRPIGRLVRSPAEHEYLATRDLVYLSFSRLSDVSCGDVYTTYRPLHPKLRHPKHRLRKVGDIYEITGEVRIIDINDQVATAEVIRAYTELMREDLVADFIPVKRAVTIRSSTKDMDGYIVGSLRPPQESLTNRDVVYVDRGDVDGVADGDAFYIVRHGDGLDEGSRRDSALPDKVVGRLVVVEVGASVSTAIITEAVDMLKIGDRISMQVF